MEIIEETERLVLRKFTRGDVDNIAPILADAEVMRFSSNGPLTHGQSVTFVDKVLGNYREKGYGQWALINKEDGKMVGFCGFFFQDVDGQSEVELAFRLDHNEWGKGLATEAAKACCDFAFQEMNLGRIISIIHPDNAASIRVAEKVGMQLEKETMYKNINVQIYALARPS